MFLLHDVRILSQQVLKTQGDGMLEADSKNPLISCVVLDAGTSAGRPVGPPICGSFLPHSGFRVIGPLTWQLWAPQVSSSDKAKISPAFFDIDLELL